MQDLPEFALQYSKSKWYDLLQLILSTALNWIAQHAEVTALLWLRTVFDTYHKAVSAE